MILRRLIFVMPLILAACGGTSGASAPEAPSCDSGDLSCGLIQTDDIGYLFGGQATFRTGEVQSTLEGSDWCGVSTPAPTVSRSLVLTASLKADKSDLSIVSSMLKFAPGKAENFFDVVESLPQGCDWIEGGVRFQFLDTIEPRLFADESTGALFRVFTDAGSQNIQTFWLRQGDIVQSVAFAPSVSASSLIDAILDVANQKLQGVTS